MVGLVNNEFQCERMWSWPNLRRYPNVCLKGLKIAGLQTEIQTKHLQNTIHMRYRLNQVAPEDFHIRKMFISEIGAPRGSEYENYCLMGCDAM
jgi:hypothetical protein